MRIFELSSNNRGEVITLPVNPSSFELSEPKLNQKITLLNIGEINLLGQRGLATGTLSSFFPSTKSPFYRRADREPNEYINTLQKWKNGDDPIRLIVSGSNINLAMTIDKLTYSQKEGDGDIYYTVDLSEYRYLNVSAVASPAAAKDSGLKERPNTKVKSKEELVRSVNDTLWAMACRNYGDGTKWTDIAKANNITDPKSLKIGQRVVIP